jgi:putative flippase GtrA
MVPSPSPRLLRSCLAGLAATAVDLSALLLLVEVPGLQPRMANVPALLLGACIQYFGNKYLAFGDRSPVSKRQVWLFGLVEVGALIANAWIFHVLVTLVPASYALARPLGSLVVYLGFSYPLWTRVFSRAHPFPTEEPGT